MNNLSGPFRFKQWTYSDRLGLCAEQMQTIQHTIIHIGVAAVNMRSGDKGAVQYSSKIILVQTTWEKTVATSGLKEKIVLLHVLLRPVAALPKQDGE